MITFGAGQVTRQHFPVNGVDCNVGDGDDNLVRARGQDVGGDRVVGADAAAIV